MLFLTNSVESIFFIARDYQGMILPEMVKEAPEHESYIELTEVIISASRITPMKNGWYHLTSNFYEDLDLLDKYGLMSNPCNADSFHIIFAINYVYNPKTQNTLQFDPIIVHAGTFTGTSEDEVSEFSATIYVPNGKSEPVLDAEFKNYDKEYLKNHPEINKEYIIYVKYRIANFNSLSIEPMLVDFGNGSYYQNPFNDRTAEILLLEGIEDVLKGHMISFTSIIGNYLPDETGWFSGTDYLYNNIVLADSIF